MDLSKTINLVLIRGGGDLASGVAHRLRVSGFKVVMLEIPEPRFLRRSVSFASVVYENSIEVENVRAKFCENPDLIIDFLEEGLLPVIIDPEANSASKLKPVVMVDATMSKTKPKTVPFNPEFLIGLGPGFEAGVNADAVVETKRGLDLGKVYYRGTAAINTGIPGEVCGYSSERLLRSRASGTFLPHRDIGDLVEAGDVIGRVNNTEIRASIRGMIRGLIYPGLEVKENEKIGDIDPRGSRASINTISDRARAVGGGVLEAIMHRFFKQGKR